MQRAKVLGCPISKLSLDQVVGELETYIQEGKPHYISVVNVAKIVKMRSDKELDASVRSASLIGADGVPLVWASKLLGDPLPGRVNGTDLMYRLLEKANERHYRLFFFGASEEVLQKVLERVRRDYPGVEIAGAQNGYFKPEEEWNVARKIRDSHARHHLHRLRNTEEGDLGQEIPGRHGCPDRTRGRRELRCLCRIDSPRPGVDAELGSGVVLRLLQEPRRMWSRYLVTNSVFVYLLFKELIRVRLGLDGKTA